MVETELDIHGMVKVRIRRDHAHPLDSYLMRPLEQHVGTSAARTDVDFRIHRKMTRTKPSVDTVVLDGRWSVDGEGVCFSESHKGGRWHTCIRQWDREDAAWSVDIATNALGRMVYPSSVVGPLIKMRMNLRGAADVHGAAVASRQGQGILLAGRSGVGKTVSALRFAREGYRLLGDDQVWIRRGEILSNVTPLSIRHTFDPQSTLGLSLSPRQRIAVRSKRWLAALTGGAVTLFTRFRPRDFGLETGRKARLAAAILLVPGNSFAVDRNIPRDEFVDQVARSNWFEMRGLEEVRLAYVHANPGSSLRSYWELHRENLLNAVRGIPCHRVHTPGEYTAKVFEMLRSFVEEGL